MTRDVFDGSGNKAMELVGLEKYKFCIISQYMEDNQLAVICILKLLTRYLCIKRVFPVRWHIKLDLNLWCL